MRVPIRLGLQIPNFNFPNVPVERLFERLVDIATTAERSGFDSVWVMDHLHQIANVGPPTNWMLEGNTILAGLAGRTERANLGLMVGGVTYRNPALLAKITTTIDVISGGRAILGIGAAWNEAEHVAYGFDFPPLRERFERLEDALNIARAMFTQDQPSYEGRHHSITEVLNRPQPLRGDIPILVGGSGERKTLRLVAQYADASNVAGSPEQVRHLMQVLDGHCADVGRDPAEIVRTRLGAVAIGRTHEQAEAKLRPLLERPGVSRERLQALMLSGDADEVGEQASALLDAGIDGLVVSLIDAHDLESVAFVGETLGALVGARA